MKTIAVVLVSLLICVPAFSFAQPCNSIQSIDWMLGHWVADDGESITIEHWKKASPRSFEGYGESREKRSNERQHSESLRLVEMANELFYLAKPEQNDFPVAFKLTQCSKTNAVFENATHDFPKKLDYQLGLNKKMTVTVSGEKGKSFEINFIRRNDS
jgi:hypothetical protein